MQQKQASLWVKQNLTLHEVSGHRDDARQLHINASAPTSGEYTIWQTSLSISRMFGPQMQMTSVFNGPNKFLLCTGTHEALYPAANNTTRMKQKQQYYLTLSWAWPPQLLAKVPDLWPQLQGPMQETHFSQPRHRWGYLPVPIRTAPHPIQNQLSWFKLLPKTRNHPQDFIGALQHLGMSSDTICKQHAGQFPVWCIAFSTMYDIPCHG